MTTWAEAQALFSNVWKEEGAKRRNDLKKHKYTADYRAHMEQWVGYLEAAKKTYDGKEPKALDVNQEAAWCALQHEPANVLAWWQDKMGAAFVIRAWCRMWAIDWFGIERYNYVTETDQHPEFPVARNGFGAWDALRKTIAKAVSESARKEAEAIRKRAPLALRIALDFVFPNERAWADEDAAAHLGAKEACFDYLFQQGEYGAALLASGASRPQRDAIAAQLAKWGGRACGWGAACFVPIAIERHGEDAVPQVSMLMSQRSNDKKKEFAAIIATVANSSVVARVLAAGLEDKTMRAVAQEYLVANADVARPVLEELVAKRGKVAEAAAHVLARIAPSKPPRIAPAAKLEDLPHVLAKPPWESGKKKTKLPSVTTLKELPYKESIQWKQGEREQHEKPSLELEWLKRWNEIPKNAQARSKDLDAHIVKKLERAGDGADFFRQLHYASTYLHAMTDAAALDAWTTFPPRAWGVYPDDVHYALARFDTKGIDGWLRFADSLPQKVIESAEHIDSPRIAPFIADTFRHTKRAAVTARKWLVAHAEPAAIALIPLALSVDEKKRAAPCAALRAMPLETVRSVATSYGEDARKAVDAVLAFDPLDDYPDKLPKLPEFFDASRLPAPVLLSGGETLPASAMTAMATMLAFSHPLDPYPGLLEVKRACEPGSLREFAWALFQEWMLADAPSKFDWALTGLGHFGDDEIARRLAPKIREWPGEGGHARAVKGLDVLANIGSDVALMHLDRIAQKLKFKGLQEKARAKMQEIAEARNLTPDELGDRIAPTLDLDEDGSKTFDVNGKKFRVTFDADLKPMLKNEDGKIVCDLPKPSSPDWKALKKDAKTVAASQIFRLERAMCTKRTWTKDQFREFFVMHPLVSHLARRLVWKTASGKTFRVAEDRSYADGDDKAFTLDEAVTLPHRLALDDTTIARWSNVFAEYEILQPFPQLARETYAPASKEQSASAIARFDKTKVATGRVLHLEDRGWCRGVPQDAGWIWDMRKDLGGGVSAELALGGGILAGDMRESPAEQELGAITLTAKISTLDPIAFSELVRDVAMLSSQ